MEAMASGLPVVAADACALGELVQHGRNGFLATPGRSGEVAAYLDILLASPGRRAAMAAAGLALIRGHEHGRALAEWESLYGRLTAGTTAPGQAGPITAGAAPAMSTRRAAS
jgi:glycosyltransferase involved in cell wall biosynthesis